MHRGKKSISIKSVALLAILVVAVSSAWYQTLEANAAFGRRVQGLDYMRQFGKALALYAEQSEIKIVTNFGSVPTEHFTAEGVDLRFPQDKSGNGWGNILREGMKLNDSPAQRYPAPRPRAESAIDLESIVGLPTGRFHTVEKPNPQLANAIKWGKTMAILPDACRWNYQAGETWATFCKGSYVRLAPDLSVKRRTAKGVMLDRGFILNIRAPHFTGNREQYLRDGVFLDLAR